MDHTPPPKREVILADLLAAPFLAIHVARSIIHKASLSIDSRKNDSAAPHPQTPNPPQVVTQGILTTSNPHFEIADRTHSQRYGQLTVSFYLYSKANRIKLVGKKGGKVREMSFTPKIAKEHHVPFCMDSAVEWVRKNGFSDQFGPVQEEENVISIQTAEKKECISENVSKPNPVKRDELENKEISKRKTGTIGPQVKLFYGKVLRIGEITRPAVDEKPAYRIFAIQLEASYGGVLKEFAGEHLQELATSHGVEVGQQIGIQRIGRKQFNVMVDGKLEERTRNEFILDPLK